MGFVYAVALRGKTKIGRTDSIDQRLKQLQPAKLLHCFESDADRNIEVMLHEEFKEYRFPQSEWFDLDQHALFRLALAMSASEKQLTIPHVQQVETNEEQKEVLNKQQFKLFQLRQDCIFPVDFPAYNKPNSKDPRFIDKKGDFDLTRYSRSLDGYWEKRSKALASRVGYWLALKHHGIEVNADMGTHDRPIRGFNLHMLPGVNLDQVKAVQSLMNTGVSLNSVEEVFDLLSCPDRLKERWTKLLRFNL